eukprot:347386-Pelagomonas_calceolata.AAC.6
MLLALSPASPSRVSRGRDICTIGRSENPTTSASTVLEGKDIRPDIQLTLQAVCTGATTDVPFSHGLSTVPLYTCSQDRLTLHLNSIRDAAIYTGATTGFPIGIPNLNHFGGAEQAPEAVSGGRQE